MEGSSDSSHPRRKSAPIIAPSRSKATHTFSANLASLFRCCARFVEVRDNQLMKRIAVTVSGTTAIANMSPGINQVTVWVSFHY